MNILVTGAAGYIGRLTVARLAAEMPPGNKIIATDIRQPPAVEGVISQITDIRSDELVELLKEHQIDVVVHLAAIVTPPPGATREFLFDVEVNGTRNVLEACMAAGVGKFVYTSSGAAYGYSPDNAALLFEDAPLRGNQAFAYAYHKRLVEELLAEYRTEHPELQQLIFRVSTILGRSVNNQITALFEKKFVVGIRGVDTPFCFIWDEDVVSCLTQGALGDRAGIYNLTGDGVMTLREVAVAMGGRHIALPDRLLERGLRSLHKRGLSQYGPEQLMFLRHRPVMANQSLKKDFGYVPTHSRDVFALYRQGRAR